MREEENKMNDNCISLRIKNWRFNFVNARNKIMLDNGFLKKLEKEAIPLYILGDQSPNKIDYLKSKRISLIENFNKKNKFFSAWARVNFGYIDNKRLELFSKAMNETLASIKDMGEKKSYIEDVIDDFSLLVETEAIVGFLNECINLEMSGKKEKTIEENNVPVKNISEEEGKALLTIIDFSKLEGFLTVKFKREKGDILCTELKHFVPLYSKSEIAALASVIYNSGAMSDMTKPTTYKKWLNIFTDICGKKRSTYKECNLKTEIEKIKRTFSLIFP